MTSETLNIVILAAGKGTRMRSKKPKVLQPLAGKPMLGHIVDTALQLSPKKIIVVVGYEAQQVRDYLDDYFPTVITCEQKEQLGTGNAVLSAAPELDDEATVIILNGDLPLMQADVIRPVISAVTKTQLALLAARLEDPTGYGRVIVSNDIVERVVEQKDGTPEELAVNLVNTNALALTSQHLREWLPQVSNDNNQQEYYLLDILDIARQHDVYAKAIITDDTNSIMGVNDKQQLAELEGVYQQQQTDALLTQGVTLIDPTRVDIRGDITVGMDVLIDNNVILEGTVQLGNNVTIHANCILRDCVIGDGTVVHPFSMIDGSKVADNCSIGPYARIRPDSVLASESKVGNFVEMKKSTLGPKSKANHFTYLGDAVVGKSVNIGAGTITCNYDGANKHQTIIGDHAFIGSNSSLVAPITIGDNATIGAGSTLGGEISAGGLTLSRGAKKHLPNWQRPTKKSTS